MSMGVFWRLKFTQIKNSEPLKLQKWHFLNFYILQNWFHVKFEWQKNAEISTLLFVFSFLAGMWFNLVEFFVEFHSWLPCNVFLSLSCTNLYLNFRTGFNHETTTTTYFSLFSWKHFKAKFSHSHCGKTKNLLSLKKHFVRSTI